MKKKPSVITVAGGEKFRATVLKVITRDEDGSPRTFEILREDERTKVSEGLEFWVVYASENVLKPKSN